MPEAPLKILLITDTQAQTGGAELQFQQLKGFLQDRPNIEVHSLVFGSEAAYDASTTVISETPSKFWRQWWRMFLNPVKYCEIRRVLQKVRPDVVHLHNVKKYTIALLTAVRHYPTLQTVHDFSLICPTGWNIHRDGQPCPTGIQWQCWWQHRRDYSPPVYLALLFSFYRLRRLVKQSVRQFIAPSPLLESYLRRQTVGATLYLPPFLQPQAEPTFTQQQANHFLYVGQLELQKGIKTLIHEFALACQRNKNLVLKMAGTGTQHLYLQKIIQQLGLEKNILLLGWVKPDLLYEECSALIFSSIGLESFGMVIAEAMARGRAVIGSARGPTTWLIENDHTGLFFNPDKAGDLAAKIAQFTASPALAKQYGRHAYEKFSEFLTPPQVIDKIMTLYENLYRSQ